jgi:hypothetical protein
MADGTANAPVKQGSPASTTGPRPNVPAPSGGTMGQPISGAAGVQGSTTAKTKPMGTHKMFQGMLPSSLTTQIKSIKGQC